MLEQEKHFSILRLWRSELCVTGVLHHVVSEWSCDVLELPWKNNEPRISCIPAGDYEAELQWSPKRQRMVYELLGVPGRTEIQVHSGNTVEDTEGCILLGERCPDGVSLTKSRLTVRAFQGLGGGDRILVRVRWAEGCNPERR
jgi:hypothetical protein